MAAPRNRPHIIVPGKAEADPYRPHGRDIDVEKPPAPKNRGAHGRALKKALTAAVVEAHQRREEAGM